MTDTTCSEPITCKLVFFALVTYCVQLEPVSKDSQIKNIVPEYSSTIAVGAHLFGIRDTEGAHTAQLQQIRLQLRIQQMRFMKH